jgi:hypothetical protein
MLSQDFDEVVSRDKLYDIVTSFVSNNLEMLKTKLAMSYKGETSVLPDNAKTGDVYRIAETIYEKDTIYIPCYGVDIGFGTAYSGDDEYTTRVEIGLDSLASQICSACKAAGKISIVSDMFVGANLHTADVVDYKASKGYLDIKNKSEYFISVLLTAEGARYIIPDELIEKNRLSEYKIANYFKGDCVVYENGTWKKLGNDEIANIYSLLNKLMIETDNQNDSFAETIDSLNMYKVDTDLSNVDNEVFKAKAEAAGVGGDAGLADEKNFMVFKGVVSELPETANEGEVYKVVSASVEKGEQVGTYNGIAGCAAITPNSIWGYANGADFVSAVRNAYLETSERPAPVVIESDGNTYHILVSGYHYEDSPIGTIDYIDGVTNVNAEVQLDDAIVYKGIAKKTEEILTRFNGEWVEL